jgi:hypothetical protein
LRTYLALGAALCLLGCAELRWDKAGADAEALAQDLESCRSQARATLSRSTTIASPVIVAPQIDPVSKQITTLGSAGQQPSLASRAIEEQEAADRCMRGKGYHLVPVQQ